MICLHCHNRPVSRPRGLCWTCYYQPGVRDRYSPIGKFGRRGILDFNGSGAPAAMPTPALPGSAAKVAVLARRAQLRQCLWHPLDATNDAPLAESCTIEHEALCHATG